MPAPSPMAYVFWHRPGPAAAVADYEAELSTWHTALGRPGSVTFHVDRTPFDGRPAYEDWYPVEGWTDLGGLEAEALAAVRRAAHDRLASAAGWGTGAVYRRVADGPSLPEATHAAWYAKPDGVTYDDLARRHPAGCAIWQRQLVLGPAPEFVAIATAPVATGLDHAPARLRAVGAGPRP